MGAQFPFPSASFSFFPFPQFSPLGTWDQFENERMAYMLHCRTRTDHPAVLCSVFKCAVLPATVYPTTLDGPESRCTGWVLPFQGQKSRSTDVISGIKCCWRQKRTEINFLDIVLNGFQLNNWPQSQQKNQWKADPNVSRLKKIWGDIEDWEMLPFK